MPVFAPDSPPAQAWSQVTGPAKHEAKWTHELLAGVAAFAAAEAVEKHVAAHGGDVSHAHVKAVAAAAAGAVIGYIVDTHGLDALDKAKAKHHATETAVAAVVTNQETVVDIQKPGPAI